MAMFQSDPLEFRRLSPEWRDGFGTFCHALEEVNDLNMFHPHSFDSVELDRIVRYSGLDLYYIMIAGASVLGYGLLRGWDEGYAVPSLGIAVHPSYRGRGLGMALMHFLHAAARWRGAEKVRLRVNQDNAVAKSLYQSVGYTFSSMEGEYIVGYKDVI